MGDARAKMGTPGTDVKGAMIGTAGGGGRVLYKAVVVEYLNDPSVWTEENLGKKFGADIEDPEDDSYKAFRISNPQFLIGAPRNSCVVRPISQGFDKQQPPILAYAFFPPHLCFPIKPGEQVWLITESPSSIGELPMWMCRVPERLQVDDLNFTHGDRKLSTVTSQTTSEKLEQEEESKYTIPKFPNGTGRSASETSLKPELGNNEETPFEDQENSYDVIVTHSVAYTTDFTPEEVPRFTKRPGDLVLQGSNNTAVILGEDRGWPAGEDPTDAEHSNATEGYEDLPAFKGTIDIVAGRGRFFGDELIGETTADAAGDDPEMTQPRLTANERKDGTSYIEVDKNPDANELDHVPPEGDPDFVRDCSRVYVSMKTDGDKNFGISAGLPEPFTIAAGFETAIEDVDASPYVVIKSDEVRLIARKDEDNDVNGSIRIVKQGTPDDDLATIVLLSDGTIQISGAKIYLGRHVDDGGVGEDDGAPGEGNSQPYVKYQQLEEVWQAFMDEVSAFCDTVLTHTTPGYGAPSVQLNQAATDLKSAISSTHKPDIANVQSERIFGE